MKKWICGIVILVTRRIGGASRIGFWSRFKTPSLPRMTALILSSLFLSFLAIIMFRNQISTFFQAAGNDPVAYYKFDEGQGSTTQDWSTNNYDGTLGTGDSAPSWQTEDACLSGKCVSFDGVNDSVTVSDASGLDLTNTGTLQAWVRNSNVGSTNITFGSWLAGTAPDGAGISEHVELDSVIVGDKRYHAAFLINDGTESFHTGSMNLDGSGFSGWTSQTAPNGGDANDNSSVGVSSDGVNLYYAAFTHTGATEYFYTASSSLDGSGFSSWTSQTAPDGAGADEISQIDMVVANAKMYFVAFFHTGGTEYFYTASANLDGTGFSGWTTITPAPNGPGLTDNSSVGIDSDGQKLYYAAFGHDNGVGVYSTGSTNFDGTGFSGWTAQSAPAGGGNNESSYTDMVIAGDTIYYATYLNNSGAETFRTASSNLDGTSFTGWTARTAPNGAGTDEEASVSINTDGKKLYYTAFAHDELVESFYTTSADIPSKPIISKSGAYELIQVGNGLVFDWAGKPQSFGTISKNNWDHIEVAYDGTNMKFYVNTRLLRTQAVTTDFTSNSNDLLIGTNATTFFTGRVDDIRIYDYARSADQIKTDFAARGTKRGVAARFGDDDLSRKLSSGLVGYWKMDEGTGPTATDFSGNNNTGTLASGDSAPTWSSGKFGTGLDFDGSNDYVFSQSSSDISGLTQMTVSVWVNSQTASTQYLISKWSSLQFTSRIDAQKNIWFFSGSGSNNFAETATSLTADTWQLVTLVYDGTASTNSGRLKIYFDAVSQPLNFTGTIISSIPTGSDIYNFGRLSSSGGGYFNGSIDEVRIYNRALDPSEVKALYAFAPGPVGHWKMDESSGTSAVDSSGNGYTGTLGTGNSAPTWTNGKFGKALNFDGDNDVLSIGSTITGIRTVSFWVNPASTTNAFIDLDGGSHYVSASTGTISATGFSPATINVNGVVSSTLAAGSWQFVSITSGTEMSGTNITIGKANASYLNGRIDDVKFFNYMRTPKQIIEDMNAGHPAVGTPVGSTVLDLKMDEGYGSTTYDWSPQVNNGTLATGSSAPSWTNDGKFGKALSFDGTSDYVSVTDDTSLRFDDASSDFSVFAWVKRGASGAIHYVVSKEDADNDGWRLQIDSGNTVTCSTGVTDVTSTTTITDTNWHHVGCTIDRGGNGQVYLDAKATGVAVGVGSTAMATTAPLHIGSRSYTRTSFFNGTIDEVKIYPFALTADQVKLEFNQGKAQVMGAKSTGVGGTGASFASGREYCVPGDATSCSAPVGEWKMDDNVSGNGQTIVDTSGSGSNGTTSSANGTGMNCTISGKSGKGCSFDNVDDRVAMGDISSLNVNDDVDFTFSAWVNIPSFADNNAILAKKQGLGAGSAGYQMYVNSSTGQIAFYAADGSQEARKFSTNTMVAGVWNYVTAVYDDDTDIVIYINGVAAGGSLAGDAISTVDSLSNATNFTVGAESDGEMPYSGSIDQVRVYNYARTPAQIAWEYNRGAPMAWYKFDECTGTTENDWGPNGNGGFNGNNGTITAGDTTGTNDSVGTCTSGNSDEMWANGATGKRNASLDFDGTNDYVSIADTSPLRFDASTLDFSLFAWIKRTTTGTEYIISKEDADDDGYRLQFNASNQVLCSEDGTDVTSTSTIIDTNWHHIGCTIDRDGNGQVYIDGKANGTTVSMGTDAMATTTAIRIGTRSYTSTSYFDGQIDEVKIFNYALTPAQVKTEMAGGAIRFE